MKKIYENLVIVLILSVVGLPSLLMAISNDWVWYMVVLSYLMPYIAFFIIFAVFYFIDKFIDRQKDIKRLFKQEEIEDKKLKIIRESLGTDLDWTTRWEKAKYKLNQEKLDKIKSSVLIAIETKQMIIRGYQKELKELTDFATKELGLKDVVKPKTKTPTKNKEEKGDK